MSSISLVVDRISRWIQVKHSKQKLNQLSFPVDEVVRMLPTKLKNFYLVRNNVFSFYIVPAAQGTDNRHNRPAEEGMIAPFDFVLIYFPFRDN